MTGFASAQPWRECTRPRTSPGFSKVVDDAKTPRDAGWLCSDGSGGRPGRPEFVERRVISTWGACFLVLRWVPRGPECGVSDPTGIGNPLRSFSFLPSQFVLASGELGVGRTCCAAQADRDLSETPPRHGRWSTTGGTSAGAWGVWAKASRMGFP